MPLFPLIFCFPPLALIFGWLGWYFGGKLEKKYPNYRSLRWLGIVLGIVLGCLGGFVCSYLSDFVYGLCPYLGGC